MLVLADLGASEGRPASARDVVGELGRTRGEPASLPGVRGVLEAMAAAGVLRSSGEGDGAVYWPAP